MCIVCQTITVGAAALTGILPIATPELYEAPTPPSIAGTTCKKVGNVRATTAGRFTCTAAKKKNVWRRNTKATTPTTPAVPAGYLKPTCGAGLADCPTESPANANIDECKLTDATPSTGGSQGFPRSWKAKPGKAELNVLVLPVRYANTQITEAELRAQYEPEFEKTRDFFKRNSYGRVTPTFTIESESQWVNIADPWDRFVLARNSDLRRVIPDVVGMIPRQNLQAFDSIFIVAAGGTVYWGGADLDVTYTHSSGTVHSVYYQTGPASNAQFPHNIGHTAYYMEDLYLHPYYRTPGADINPLKYEVMASGDDFTVWNRWLAGFVYDSEVRCVSAGTTQTVHHVVQANDADGEKMVMIPTAPGKAVFAEYIAYAGVHVYDVDSTIGHGAGPMKTVGFLKVGQSLTHNNVKVELTAADATGVYLTVTR
ncbi:MAG: hypothetical protein ACO3Z1_04690 [Ilumatobacteraceae bacterium]